jgi:hypothetical protein
MCFVSVMCNKCSVCCSVDNQKEETVSFKSVYSMIVMVKIVPFLYERETGKNGVGREQEREKERKREREKERKREREKERKSAGDRV